MRIDVRPPLTLALTMLVGAAAARAQPQVIDFEELTHIGNATWDSQTGPLLSKGFSLSGTHFHTISNFTSSGGTAWNGSKYVLANEGGSFGAGVVVARADGQPFSFSRVDAAELWVIQTSFPNATQIRMVGTYPDTTTKTLVFPLDGINDGPSGSANDFQTLDFSGQFVGIASVMIDGLGPTGASGFAWALDNFEMGDGCATSFGDACAGSGGFKPELKVSACDLATGPVTIEIANGLGGSTAVFFIGLSKVSVPIGQSGCSLLVSPLFVAPFAFPLGGSGPGAGTLIINATLPIASLSGTSFTLQSAIADGASLAGFTTTNGLEFTIP